MQRILMVGKPNCGKSLLFNQLTGLRQKVANYPGITVEVTRGKFDKFELVDLPGAYSLNGLTRDEVIAVDGRRVRASADVASFLRVDVPSLITYARRSCLGTTQLCPVDGVERWCLSWEPAASSEQLLLRDRWFRFL